MNEKLGIETCTTAAESPFSNGVCERHNAVIAEAMKKTIEEEKCDPEIALAWAISAKNALHNNSGYSPNELIFGYNVNSLSVLTDKLPALEPHTTSDMVRIMQNARHTAMKNHIEVDASDKIRKALRAKTRTYADEHYEPGEKIYYQRPSDRGKRGPATVLGVDGQLVLVRHGGQFMRIHPCQLQKVKLSTKPESKPEVNMEKIETQPKNKVIEKNDIDDESEINIREEFVNEENENEVAIPNIEKQTNVKLKNGNEKPKRKMEVEFKIEGEAKWRTAKVIQAQPKAGGKYKNWVNVEEKDGKQVCIRWSDVEKWKEIVNEQSTDDGTEKDTDENVDGSSEDSVEEVVLFTDNREKSKEVAAAKEKELNNMKKNDVYEIVPYIGQPTVSSRWIFTEKLKNEEIHIKARLVARGYEENKYEMKTDSPTCSREALRMVMLTGAMMKWVVQTIDFTAAFLQGEQLEREVFLKLPPDVCPSTEVWKLKKCIYGLNDAPRCWFKRICNALIKL